jgi:hypothetical protein
MSASFPGAGGGLGADCFAAGFLFTAQIGVNDEDAEDAEVLLLLLTLLLLLVPLSSEEAEEGVAPLDAATRFWAILIRPSC